LALIFAGLFNESDWRPYVPIVCPPGGEDSSAPLETVWKIQTDPGLAQMDLDTQTAGDAAVNG
jgi:hypothetical protein